MARRESRPLAGEGLAAPTLPGLAGANYTATNCDNWNLFGYLAMMCSQPFLASITCTAGNTCNVE